MKKKILAVMAGILLVSANLYAAGDLQVNGTLGIGTTPSSQYKTDTSAGNIRGTRVVASQDQDGVVAANIVQGMNLTAETGGTATGNTSGIALISKVTSTAASVGQAVGGNFTVALTGASTGTSNVSLTMAGKFNTLINAGVRDYVVAQGYGFDLLLADNTFDGVGSLLMNDYVGVNINDADNAYGALSVDNLTGLRIAKQTLGGTSNYGIVLDGYGATGDYGAAIVFGENQGVRLYAKADGKLYVHDGTNETQHSPHDPVTNEWIFFSKNVKTGKVLRVNMEQLVKAVEKITGEQFMFETLEEIK